MAKRKFSEEQILGVGKHLEAGRTAVETAREVGVSTFHDLLLEGEVWRDGAERGTAAAFSWNTRNSDGSDWLRI